MGFEGRSFDDGKAETLCGAFTENETPPVHAGNPRPNRGLTGGISSLFFQPELMNLCGSTLKSTNHGNALVVAISVVASVAPAPRGL